MAQKGTRRKQAPQYSADTMALRYMGGLALIALGVMVFMAVVLRTPSEFFNGLRQVCWGISGSLAAVLPILLLWGGGLVIWSAQRQAPVRPWVFALLSFIGICTFIMLISRSQDKTAMEMLDNDGKTFGGVIGRAFTNCSTNGTGGGALGMILGWPLWKFSPALAIVIIFLATVFCLLMMVSLTPRRIKELVTGEAGRIRDQRQQAQMQAEQQQVAWQQQQAIQQQQQAMWQQEQQRRIIEQQQQQAYAAQQNAYPQNGEYPQQNPQPGMQPGNYPGNTGVEAWQEQLTNRQAAGSQTGHQSRIFGRKETENPAKADRPRISKIFGKKEAEYDGLVDTQSAAAAAAAAMRHAQKAAEKPARRTATGTPIAKPETLWTTVTEEAEAEAAAAMKKPQPGKIRTAPENVDNYRRPQTAAEKKPAAEQIRAEIPEQIPAETPAEEPARPSRGARTAVQTTARPAPGTTQTIGEQAYKPKLKLPPKDEAQAPEEEFWMPTPYNYPPITDLALPKPPDGNTAEEDMMRSRKLEETLASFKVQARVVNVTHGPAISRFELELATGTKVNKVAELEKDIAYNMEATSIRIEAPIPGKSLVGVEVPNRKVATVTLREVLSSERMQNAKSLLTVALGKDIAGTPIVCDLAKMPHMLIAGQTGSGKSVCINAIINSLLYRASPDEVRLILVDPKVVELQCYNGIPHLLIPVVNDPHKAAAALAWAVAEMMERYDKFAERKVRNLDGYNAVLGEHEKPMSRIVIIIDELADLMMVCKKDVEEYICRLTQLARAAGIHLIVATQRPSVDVITGLIKANIPSRIAFKTASYVDSRTILDRNGSEQLLGWGDMLYLPTGSFAPTRVQGCFLSDEEVNRIVTHVRDANPSTYDPDILEKLEQIQNGTNTEGTGADMIGGTADMGGNDSSLFEQAVEYAIADGQISTSTLQRRLKIGYARAGRLTDEMEERGIVAAKDGSKPRKCLITREEWEEMKQVSEV